LAWSGVDCAGDAAEHPAEDHVMDRTEEIPVDEPDASRQNTRASTNAGVIPLLTSDVLLVNLTSLLAVRSEVRSVRVGSHIAAACPGAGCGR
jgi:hypothetical protein